MLEQAKRGESDIPDKHHERVGFLASSPTRRLLSVLLVMLVCVGVDQGTKAVAAARLAGAPSLWYLNGMVCLEYTENMGAFMGLGSNLPPTMRRLLWIGLVFAVLALTVGFAVRTPSLSAGQFLCLSLVAAGGVGNLIDRVLNQGAVIDWVSVGIGPLRTGVLNIADVAITGGSLLFVLLSLKRGNGDGDS